MVRPTITEQLIGVEIVKFEPSPDITNLEVATIPSHGLFCKAVSQPVASLSELSEEPTSPLSTQL